MKFNFKLKVILIGFLVMIFSLGLLGFAVNYFFTREYTAILGSNALAIGSSLKFQLDRILQLGIPLEQVTGFEMQCQEVVDKYDEIEYAIVIDEKGNVLFHNEGYETGLYIARDIEVLDAIMDNKEFIHIHNEANARYYNVILPVNSLDGKPSGGIIIGFPVSAISEKIRNMVYIYILLSLISLVLGLSLLVFFLSRWVSMPINRLLEVIRSIRKEGNLHKRVSINSKDEIGELASEFNRMTDSLEKSKKELERYNEGLESQVDERTSDLNQKIKELEDTKLATLNILEDVDEANKELIKARMEVEEKISELRVADKKKDEFISVTAHELKTPLTSIRGFTELLKNPKVMNKKSTREEYFNVIIEDTVRLERLITDILDLTKLDLGTMKFSYEKISMQQLMDDLKNLVDIQIKNKKLKSVYEAGTGIPEFYTDKSRVLQVISNLVNNSIKFTDRGSIKVMAFRKDNYLHFKVEDTGIGIPKKEHGKLFQRFYQVDSTYTRKVGGSGLGLSICRGIVEALGGKIWFTSRVGKGTVFEFRIKLIQKEEELPSTKFGEIEK